MEKDFNAFLQANEGRIYYQIQRLKVPVDLHDEFYAEGIVVLWNAYQNYDANKGELGTFINYKLRFRFIDLIRKDHRQAEIMDMATHEHIIEIDDGNRFTKTGLPIMAISDIPLDNEVFWREVQSVLSNKQWKWVHYNIIADLTVKEIMEIENVSAEAVKSWAREARKKLRKKEVWEKLVALV